jgi:hypothetical protein
MADAIASGRPMRPSGVILKKRARAIGFSLKGMRLVQFDGRIWQQIGDVIETAFSDTPR